MGEGTTAEGGGAAHEIAVRRAADTNGEEPAVPEVAADTAEQRRLVADRTVGDQHHLAQPRPADLAIERQCQSRGNIGAAVRLQPVDTAQRAREVAPTRGPQTVIQGRRIAGEAHHIEPVFRPQPFQREAQRRLGLRDRIPMHRAGRVDNEHDVAWDQWLRRRGAGRRRDDSHHIGFLVPGLTEEGGERGRAGVRTPL